MQALVKIVAGQGVREHEHTWAATEAESVELHKHWYKKEKSQSRISSVGDYGGSHTMTLKT